MLIAKTQIPKRPRGALLRTRLTDALLEHIDCKLQFLIAPAGFGKTTLLVDLVHDGAFATAWITLDASDRDLGTFVESLVSTLRHVAPTLGARTLANLRATPNPSDRARSLAKDLTHDVEEALDGLTVLVLDDYHEVDESGPVTAFLDELLRLLPEPLRLVLASRSIPSLTVSRLIVDRHVFGLGEADLRFTSAELLTLLRRTGQTVTAEQAATMAQGAEGWVAGFLLSVPQFWDGIVGGMIAAGGGEGPLYDYLAAEAFDGQPAELQRFLLATCVPETPDLACVTALLGPGDWSVARDRVERAGLFLTRLHGRNGAFRYHQLFRRFLLTRLRRTSRAEYTRLHALAAREMSTRGAWPEALAHLREAEQEAHAAVMLMQVAPELERGGRWCALVDAVVSLPIETVAAHPHLLLMGAKAALHLGDLNRAAPLAERLCASDVRSATPELHAWGLSCLGYLRRLQGRTAEAVTVLNQALAQAGADDEELRATVRRHLGKCLGVQGDFAGAADALKDALGYFDRTGATYDAAQAEFGLGIALAKCGRLEEAVAHYESALHRWRQLDDPTMEAEMLNCLGCAHAYQGNYANARVELEEALRRAYDAGNPLTQAATHHSLAGVLLAAGDIAATRKTLEQGLAIAQEIGELWVVTHLYDALAFTTAFEGDLTRAEEHAHHAVGLAQRQESPYLTALCQTTLGGIQVARGRDAAVQVLTAAAHRLTSMNARREMATAFLWLASSHARTGADTLAHDALRSALALVQELGSDGLLDLYVRWDPEFFRRAAGAGIDAARLNRVLERVSADVSPAIPFTLAASMPAFSARAFGPGVLQQEGAQPVAWAWEKSRELFFYLLHHGPRRREQLAAALWPDTPSANAKAALHTAVYRLRRASHPQVLLLNDGVYQVNEELVTSYDVRRFQRWLLLADELDGDAAVSLLQQAAELAAAPFLEDLESEWCAVERDYLARQVSLTLDRLSEANSAAGRLRESIAAAEQLLTLEPLREDIHARVVRLYLRLGDRAAARRQLERCAAIIWNELEEGPGPELLALQKRVNP